MIASNLNCQPGFHVNEVDNFLEKRGFECTDPMLMFVDLANDCIFKHAYSMVDTCQSEENRGRIDAESKCYQLQSVHFCLPDIPPLLYRTSNLRELFHSAL